MKMSVIICAVAVVISSSLVQAQAPAAPMSGMDHGKMDHSQVGHGKMRAGKAEAAPAARAFEAAMNKMHADMTQPYTGNADIDFMKGMVPHHQGAIDMAKVVLQYGKDPEVKKLAEQVIKAQEAEIAFMAAWLKKNQ